MGCKQTCQTFALEKGIIIIILGTEQTLSLLRVYLITFLAKIVCHKIYQFLRLQDVQKPKRTLERCLPTITIRFNFKFHSIFLRIPEGIASILNYLGILKCIMVLYVSQCLCLLPWEDRLTSHSFWCPQISTCYVSFLLLVLKCNVISSLKPPLSTFGSNDQLTFMPVLCPTQISLGGCALYRHLLEVICSLV